MKRFAIFAHYDHAHEVKRYITHHLAALREHCARIDFVSTSQLPDSEIEKLRPYCGNIYLKDNVGLDFGMWKHALDRAGLETGGLDEFDELIIVNSSVFGPVYPLGPVLDRMEGSGADFWGMTDNDEFAWHLQSYFIAFRKQAFTSEAFRAFWRSVLPYQDKRQIIRSYEVGLTTFLRESGLHGKAYSPAKELPFTLWARLRADRGNATCFHPMELLRTKMPYVKVELLRDNPARIPLEPVYRAMKESGYAMDTVEFDRAPRFRTYLWPTLAREAMRPGGLTRVLRGIGQ